MLHKVVQRRVWGAVGSLIINFAANLQENLTVKKFWKSDEN